MRNRVMPRSAAARLVAAGVGCTAALALTAPLVVTPASAATPASAVKAAGARPRPATTITIDARTNRGRVPQGQLGVNHRYVSNGHGLWDPAADRPDATAVSRMRRAGVDFVRYPGGIVGNLFDWKKAIDSPGVPDQERSCQVNGTWSPQGFKQVHGRAYGIDEHMRLLDAVGGRAIMMVPFVTETPADAADWVEYMNSPNDGSNPNDGVDWAEVRATNNPDHPQPYNVRWWEVGNEQRVGTQRYWMSPDRDKALRQYVNGGRKRIDDEMLGRDCRHPVTGVPSNGLPGQVFQMVYPPAQPDSVSVRVLRRGVDAGWTRDDDLSDNSGNDQVFSVDEAEGTVTFGDGQNGAVLPRGLKVQATYLSVHEGVFSFIRRMKAVDPRIKVCPTWGLTPFVKAAAGHRYDCFSVHSYTHFRAQGMRAWKTPTQGHDYHMLGATLERRFVANVKASLPKGVPIALTEFGAIWGNSDVYSNWAASMTHATYMASMWGYWLDLGIPLATGSDLLAPSHRGMLGPAPDFDMSAEALTRQALRPLFDSGGRRLRAVVTKNPIRNPHLGRRRGTYPALVVAATRGRDHALHVLVVNRLPSQTQRVRARVALDRFRSRRVAFVTRVNGASFRAWNGDNTTQVRLTRSRQRIGRQGFVGTFPAHSVTVLRIPGR